MATGEIKSVAEHPWDERLKAIEAKVDRLIESILGGLDGRGGIFRRADQCEAKIDDHEKRIDALERAEAARVEKAGDRLWSLALDAVKAAVGGLIGAALMAVATRGHL